MNWLLAVRLHIRREWATGILAILLAAALLIGIGTAYSRTGSAVDRVNETVAAQTAKPTVGKDVRVVGSAVKDPRVSAVEKSKTSGTAWVVVALIAFALGAVLTAGEGAAGTRGRALLEQPRRSAFIATRLIAAFALSVLGAAVVGLVSFGLWKARFSGLPSDLLPTTGDQLLATASGCAAVGLFGLLGATFGLLGRSPGAVTGVGLLVMLLGEQLLGGNAPELAKWLPGHLLEAASGHGISLWRDLGLAPGVALLGLVAWVAATGLAGSLVTVRRDVT